jgi:protein phosphatase
MRILLISDIHGNSVALRAIINKVSSYDDVLFLGDLVDYGPDPGEVIDILKELGAKGVRGNHDHAVAYGADCKCGEALHWLSVWFRENITYNAIDSADKEYLAKLPEKIEMRSVFFENIVAVHGSPSNPLYGYLYPWLNNEEIYNNLEWSFRLRTTKDKPGASRTLYLVGHTHYQFLRTVHGSWVINPGSAGQPRDGDPRAAYIIVDLDSGDIIFNRIKYDMDKVIKRLEYIGVKGTYLEALKWLFMRGSIPPEGLRLSRTG